MTTLEDIAKETYRIDVKDFTVSMFLGILDKEKTQKQTVTVTVTAWVKKSTPPFDYRKITDAITQVASRRYDWQEDFIKALSREIFCDSSVMALKVKSGKPEAFANAKTVSVEIFKVRE